MAKFRRLYISVFAAAGLLAAILLVPASWYSALAAPPAAQATATPAPSGARQTQDGQALELALAGVPNFARVTSNLYRGAQPTDTGFEELRKLGVEIVVNFRNERGEIEAERRTVERLGLRYVSIPWGASHNPTSQQVADFLEVLQANPESKIFVHCHRGADAPAQWWRRTALPNSTAPPQAIQEMRAYHYHHFWWPNLQRYVEDFPRLLATDPKLRAFAPATHATAP